MANDNLFRPYKIIQQSGSNLELQAGSKPAIMRAAFLAGPAILLVAGTALYLTQREIIFLYVMFGIAALELFVFSFIKVPSDLRMDSVGFTLKRVSIKGTEETDYLWNDVDRIRWRFIRTKGGPTLAFDAIMKEGKKIRLLNFSSFNTVKQSASEIASVLSQISHKPVAEK